MFAEVRSRGAFVFWKRAVVEECRWWEWWVYVDGQSVEGAQSGEWVVWSRNISWNPNSRLFSGGICTALWNRHRFLNLFSQIRKKRMIFFRSSIPAKSKDCMQILLLHQSDLLQKKKESLREAKATTESSGRCIIWKRKKVKKTEP